MKKRKDIIHYFSKNIITVIALVMVWRGVWYILDGFDTWLFGEYGAMSGLIGVIIGIAILYIPDQNLKEIEKI